MNASIRKEVRSVLPLVGITAVLTTVGSMVFNGREAVDLVSMLFGLGCALMGAWVLGNEFQLRTMGVLLSQPRTRQRIWGEKMAILGVALGLALGIAVLGVRVLMKSEDKLQHITEVVAGMIGMAIIVFCTTPCLTLGTKNIIGGMVLTVGVPMSIGLLIAGADALLAKMYSRPVSFLEQAMGRNPYPFLIGVGAVYCAIVYWLGYRKFMRLQVIEGQGQEIALPARLERALGKALRWIVPGYTGPTASLVRKELLVQRVSFIVAGISCVLLACEAVVWNFDKFKDTKVSSAFLVGTFAIYVLLIPFISGSVCMAEERNWGVAAWQSTLPPARRKQVIIKLLVTYFTCFLLGVAIPTLLLLAGFGWLGMSAKGSEVNWVIAAHGYLVLFTIIVYASSISRSAIRAIALALGLIMIVGLVGGFICTSILKIVSDYLDQGAAFPSGESAAVGMRINYGIVWLFTVVVGFLAVRRFPRAEASLANSSRAVIQFVAGRRRSLWIGIVCLVVLGFAAWEIFRVREPVYKGRTLSAWVNFNNYRMDKESTVSGPSALSAQDVKDFEEAMRYFLLNSLPALKSLAAKHNVGVFDGLDWVGKAAEAMTEDLKANLTEPNPIGGLSAGALANIGPKGAAILTNAATVNRDLNVRINIAHALGHYGDLAKGMRYPGTQDLTEEELTEGRDMATPVLLSMLEDPSPQLALIAANSLARFHRRPDVVVPALVRQLRNCQRPPAKPEA